MLKPIQDNRIVQITTSLGDNTLLFSSMSGSERLSTLFDYRLELISEDHQINLDDLLGTPLTVKLELPESRGTGNFRYFNGIVADCAHIGGTGNYAHYEISLRPWFWLLTRTADASLRFLGLGKNIQISLDGGSTWEYPQKQPQQDKFGRFISYFTPIPEGLTTIHFRGENWFAHYPWLVNNFSIWSQRESAH